MLPLIINLLEAAIAEGGPLAGLAGRAGLGESLATRAAGEAATEESPVSVRGLASGKVTPNDIMAHWFKPLEGGGKQPPSPPEQLGRFSGGSEDDPKRQTPQSAAATLQATQQQTAQTAANPQNQDQKKSNELEEEQIRLQKEANQQHKSWLTSEMKGMMLLNAFNYALFKVTDTLSRVGGGGGGLLGTLKKFSVFGIHENIINIAKSLPAIGMFLPRLGIKLYDFASGISESNREISSFNAALGASFGRLDMIKQQMKIQQGQATSGTGVLLNEQMGEALRSIQPIVNGVSQLTNLAATGAAFGARMITELAKASPWFKLVLDALNAIDNKLKDKPRIGPDDRGQAGLDRLAAMGDVRKVPGERPADLGGVVPRQPLRPLLKRDRQ